MKPTPKIDPEFEAFKAGLQIQDDELFIWGQYFYETEGTARAAFDRFKAKTLKNDTLKDNIQQDRVANNITNNSDNL